MSGAQSPKCVRQSRRGNSDSRNARHENELEGASNSQQDRSPCVRVPPLDRLLVSIDSAADILSISRREMVRILDAGEVDSLKRGRRRLVVVASIRRWVDAQAEDARA